MSRSAGAGGLMVTPWREAVPVTSVSLGAPGAVDLVFSRADVESFGGILNAGEWAHAQRLREETARAEYVTGRGLMRELAGQVMSIDAREVMIVRSCAVCGSDEHGKPAVTGAGAPHVSISHRGGHVVIALCSAGAVGVDIEVDRPLRELHGMASVVLSDAELRLLARLDDAAAQAWFLTRWCEKEAVSKRTGLGLSADFRDLRVPDDDTVLVLDGDYAPPGLIGALAVPVGTSRVRWLIRG